MLSTLHHFNEKINAISKKILEVFVKTAEFCQKSKNTQHKFVKHELGQIPFSDVTRYVHPIFYNV
jgi:hypothetical protein